MSGGVDSSVAAYILQEQYNNNNVDLIGLHMSNWNPLDEDEDKQQQQQSKCYEEDMKDTRRVCEHLQIPFHHASFVAEYWTDVFEPYVTQIGQQIMPNPDVYCNSKIKFGTMKEYAHDRLNVDAIATGHYARLWYASLATQHNNQDEPEQKYIDNNDDDTVWLLQPQSLSLQLNDEIEQVISESIDNDNDNNDSSSLEWLRTYGVQENIPLLLAGADLDKDQSYFLSGVKGAAFRNVLFPLGNLYKSKPQKMPFSLENDNHHTLDNNHEGINEDDNNITTAGTLMHKTVRDIAKEAQLPTAMKKDSMGICFVGKRNFGQFISQYLPSYEPHDKARDNRSGAFVDIDTGCIVGNHDGLPYYTLTVGQGAKISGASQKWFVTRRTTTPQPSQSQQKDTTIFVCNHTHHPSLYSDELYIQKFNWITTTLPPPLLQHGRMRALCRTRHLQPLIPCTIVLGGGNGTQSTSSTVTLQFDCPLRAITPGQMAVVYVGGNGLVCLGGGPIENHGPTYFEQEKDLPLHLHPSGQNDLSIAKQQARTSLV